MRPVRSRAPGSSVRGPGRQRSLLGLPERPSQTWSNEVAAAAFRASRNGQSDFHDVFGAGDGRHPKVVAVSFDDDVARSRATELSAKPGQVPRESLNLGRRALICAGAGAGAYWLINAPQTSGDGAGAILPDGNVPMETARNACMEGAAVCATLHSQVSSTMRQFSAGFLPEAEFQAACSRRLASSFVKDSMLQLEDAIPVLGRQLAYTPSAKARSTPWWTRLAGRVDSDHAAMREHYEGLTLSSLQRCRRVQRLGTAMCARKFTPAGMQLLSQDLKFLCRALDELLTSVPGAPRQA